MAQLPDSAFPVANSPLDWKRGEDTPPQAKVHGKPGHSAGPDITQFVRTEDRFSRAELPRLDHLTGFGPQLALAICLFGFAWAASSYFYGDQWSLLTGSKPGPSESTAQQERKERTDLAREVKKISSDLRVLEAGMDALRAGQSQAAQTRAALEGLTLRIDADRSEIRAAIAAAVAETERVHREQQAALPQITGRLDRLERKLAAQEATPAAPDVKEQAIPAGGGRARLDPEGAEGPRKPHLITNWVVRDVYGGVALLESTRGTIEVALGEVVPGAGRVKAIERRGSGWIVVTSRGVVDSASDVFMP